MPRQVVVETLREVIDMVRREIIDGRREEIPAVEELAGLVKQRALKSREKACAVSSTPPALSCTPISGEPIYPGEPARAYWRRPVITQTWNTI